MAHLHSVVDTDTRFIIDPITRQIKNGGHRKPTLIQNDHMSEVYTFECPKTIEGHDMSQCTDVEIHFLNVGRNGVEKSGFYTTKDFHAEDENVVCTWPIDHNATGMTGSLNFLVVFKCKEDEHITYAWHTDVFREIRIAEGINADERFENDYVDVIDRWKDSVMAHFNAELAAWKARTVNEVKEEISERIDLLSNYVTPEMFGAKGDGVTDDTEAVQAALDSGYNVMLTAKYKVTALMMNGVVVEGYGATLIGDANAVAITANASTIIRGVTIVNAHIGILLKANDCKIEDCKFNNINNRSIVIFNASNCRIVHCAFKNTGGIIIQGENGGTVKNNIIDTCILNGITSDQAIYLNSSSNTLQVTECIVNNCIVDNYAAIGIFVGGDYHTISNCKIGKQTAGSTSVEPTRPLWVHDGKGNVIEDCHFIESNRGLYIINARDTMISNCYFENIKYYNINAIYNDSETAVYRGIDGNSGITVRGCIFSGGSGSYSVILIDSYNRVVISDCVLRDGIMERLLLTRRSKDATIASSVIVTNCFCDCAFGYPINLYDSADMLYCSGVIDKNGLVYNP